MSNLRQVTPTLRVPNLEKALDFLTRVTVYIDVCDVDALYAELLAELATLPAGDVQAPRDRD